MRDKFGHPLTRRKKNLNDFYLYFKATMQNHHNRRQTLIDYNDRIIIDRPDTNTFVANNSTFATMGCKTSTLNWAGSPNTLFRSSGRNGSMTLGRRTPTNMSMNVR